MVDENRYYHYLEKLSMDLINIEKVVIQDVFADLEEMCKMLRVAKGLTEYYNSMTQERMGRGETYVAYDSGEETDFVMTERAELSGMFVARCQVYRAKGEEPWTEEETRRIRMIQRMMVTFITRARMQALVDQATLFDDAGYGNARFFTSRLEKLGGQQLLGNFVAGRFNIRHFSLVNQQLGKEASDQVMRDYIQTIEQDTGEGGCVGRLGGDNFVLLFRKENLDRMMKHLEGEPIRIGREEHGHVMISATAGLFVIPEEYYFHDVGDIMDRITNAQGAARQGQNGEIVFSSEAMLERKEKAMRIRQMLPVAMQNEEILVFYQPKIDIENNSLVGAEALSRWYRNGRLVLPQEFIPVLEQSMDICRLDFYVLDHVCRDIRRWLDEGRMAVRISVNLSRRHMIDLDLLDHLLEIIDRHNVPHQYIEIELTETTTDVEFKDLKRIVSGLQEAGISTSVDDFGIGYSSLNLIREIPWDILKVDKNFLPLDDSNNQTRQNIMFRHVVNMAREIGMTCIAEGVETREQVENLRKNGCEVAQGFYYDKALPVQEFEKRLDMHVYKEKE